MIRQLDQVFVLDTDNTSYAFHVLETKHLEHLYYGEKLFIDSAEEAEALKEKNVFAPGNTNVYDQQHKNFSLEDMRLEMSSYGKGDIREPFIEVVHADGGMTCDYLFESAEISKGKAELETLPSSYDETEEVDHLCITLKDAQYDLTLELHYYVFEKENVIVRSSKFVNTSEETVTLERLMSTQLDFEENDFVFTTFNGGWAREMGKYSRKVESGKYVSSSVCGSSSSRANPFVMLSKEYTSEDFGPVYGLNLVYSGNHYEACEVSTQKKTRFVNGINPQGFAFKIAPGQSFEAPEAVMTFSKDGFNGMSQNMHKFVREHISRGEWKYKVRPVLLNSWEAAYFDIDEKKLLKLAKAGKDAGVELFVMDDGWFGHRDNDETSLGDWFVNTKKLHHGVDGLCQKINELGLEFGIWVEPEMVNVDSELYKAHPNWTMEIPGKPHTEGRNQRILDFANPEVVEYMIQAMKNVINSANIAYVKWDMNRIFSDVYSQYLPADRQKETAHRYIMGVYKLAKALTEAFPEVLFEGCSAGGNRFDLGALCYFPQIWASDDTDAAFRVECQTNYSYGYPMSTVSAHVSACPNHQTLRTTPLDTRFNVAAFGVCGYECNFCDLSDDAIQEIKNQIAVYKEWRTVLQYGDFYRGRHGNNIYEWTCVANDQSAAVGMLMQYMNQPNAPHEQYKAKGLNPEMKYKFFNRDLKVNIKIFGDLLNTALPVHIKPNSCMHNIVCKFYKLPGEKEAITTSGSVLMRGGVKLKPAFAATGLNDDLRCFTDFSSRMYFIKEKELDSPIEEIEE